MTTANLRRSRRSSEQRIPAGGEGEADISRWFAEYVDAGRAKLAFSLRDIRRTMKMLRALRELPILSVSPTSKNDGPYIRSALRRPFIVRTLLASTTSVLEVPHDVGDYTSGRPKHALRQKLRAAEAMDLRFRFVDDPDERETLLHVANEYERTAAVDSMRNPEAQNGDLLRLRLWLLAETAGGAPLLLAVAAVDSHLSVLRYYRTMSADDAASVARYAAMPELVHALSDQGVRWITETGRPHWIHNGVRQFQRKVGFRLMRISVTAPAWREQFDSRLVGAGSTAEVRPNSLLREKPHA